MQSLRPINSVLFSVLALLGLSLLKSSAENVSSDVEILTNDYSNHQPSHYLHHKRISRLIASSASEIPNFFFKGGLSPAVYPWRIRYSTWIGGQAQEVGGILGGMRR